MVDRPLGHLPTVEEVFQVVARYYAVLVVDSSRTVRSFVRLVVGMSERPVRDKPRLIMMPLMEAVVVPS